MHSILLEFFLVFPAVQLSQKKICVYPYPVPVNKDSASSWPQQPGPWSWDIISELSKTQRHNSIKCHKPWLSHWRAAAWWVRREAGVESGPRSGSGGPGPGPGCALLCRSRGRLPPESCQVSLHRSEGATHLPLRQMKDSQSWVPRVKGPVSLPWITDSEPCREHNAGWLTAGLSTKYY